MKNFFSSFSGALVFYTTIRLPSQLSLNFVRIAVWLPWIGILLGCILSIIGYFFLTIGFSFIMMAIFLVALGIVLTGGLHLDGVMDTADGLAIQGGDINRQLEVMRDSCTGAFGVMAAIIILVLKLGAISSLQDDWWWGLIVAMSWGRWGQLMAIVFYNYLRKEGKGAFLKENLALPLDPIFASLFILALVLGEYFYLHQSWILIGLINLSSSAIALLVGWWFNYKLGGHTGDTYGATVEWSEAFILSVLTILVHHN